MGCVSDVVLHCAVVTLLCCDFRDDAKELKVSNVPKFLEENQQFHEVGNLKIFHNMKM